MDNQQNEKNGKRTLRDLVKKCNTPKWRRISIVAASVVLVAALAGLFVDTKTTWYQELNKPAIQLPPFAFVIAWMVVYITGGIAVYRVCRRTDKEKELTLYLLAANGAFNVMWTYFFFLCQDPPASFAVILLLLTSLLWTMLRLRKCDARASYWLLPYLIWSAYATVLTYLIVMMN